MSTFVENILVESNWDRPAFTFFLPIVSNKFVRSFEAKKLSGPCAVKLQNWSRCQKQILELQCYAEIKHSD